MSLCNSPDIFQEKMSKKFADIEEVRAYIDNLLLITNGDQDNHLQKLDEVCSSSVLLLSLPWAANFRAPEREGAGRTTF